MTEVGNFIYLIAAATMQALAMALFKIASGNDGRKQRKNGLTRGGAAVLFATSFPIYMRGLAALSLSVVQPVFSATMFLATILISAFLLKERVGARQVTGGIIIILGIIVVLQ